MTRSKDQTYTGAGELGEYKLIPYNLLLEPELPARETMDERKMDELIESLTTIGQLDPLKVRAEGAKYRIVDGHRRWFAAGRLGWSKLKCIVLGKAGVADEAVMLHSNLMREDLNPGEEAVWYHQLMEKHNIPFEELCRVVGRSEDYVSDRLRLIATDEHVFEAVRTGRISLAVAKEINRHKDPEKRAYYLGLAIEGDAGARQVRQWINNDVKQGPQLAALTATPEPTAQTSDPGPVPDGCALCGGAKDPWNLVTVQVHKWEWEKIEAALRERDTAGGAA